MKKIWAFVLLAISVPVHACINGEFTPYVPTCADVRPKQIDEAFESADNPPFMSAEQIMTDQGHYPCNADHLVATLHLEVDKHRVKQSSEARGIDSEVKKSWERYTRSPNLNSGIHHSANLLRNNQPQEALELLKTLNTLYPHEYKVATNMGTAYELLGDDVAALQWIKRGIELNPQSHYGSEWVHVKILEAKLAAKHDPHWFERSSILGLPFRKDGMMAPQVIFPTTNTGKPANLLNMIDHVGLQLKERMSLVPPQDPVVANLLFDLSYLLALQKSYENAADISQISSLYGDKQAEQTTTHFQQLDVEAYLQQVKKLVLPTFIWMLSWVGVCYIIKAILRLGRWSYQSSFDSTFLKFVFYIFSIIVICTTASYFLQNTLELILQHLLIIGHHINIYKLLTVAVFFIMVAWVLCAWILILKYERSYTSATWHWMFFAATWIWGLSFIYFNPEYLVMPWDFITFAILLSLGALISFYLWVYQFSKIVLNLQFIKQPNDVL